jgi:hypothetical protein
LSETRSRAVHCQENNNELKASVKHVRLPVYRHQPGIAGTSILVAAVCHACRCDAPRPDCSTDIRCPEAHAGADASVALGPSAPCGPRGRVWRWCAAADPRQVIEITSQFTSARFRPQVTSSCQPRRPADGDSQSASLLEAVGPNACRPSIDSETRY